MVPQKVKYPISVTPAEAKIQVLLSCSHKGKDP